MDELRDNNSKIRADAAEGLGEFVGNEKVAEELRKALKKDKKKGVRYWAASSLGTMCVKGATTDLSEALRREVNADVRAEIARALGKLGERAAIPALSEGMEREKEVEVKRAIILALRNIRDAEVLPILLKALKEEKHPSIRSMAGEAYLDVGREDAVPEALKCLKDKDSFVRMMLVEGLGDLADEQAVDEIAKFLVEDKEPSVREKAAWALGHIGDPQALEKLEGALASERDDDVRKMIDWAIERLRGLKENSESVGWAPPTRPASDLSGQAAHSTTPTNPAEPVEREIRGLILDLDDTLAPEGEPVPPSINGHLINLLAAGKGSAIITLEREEKMQDRLWGQIPAGLRMNLHIFSNGGGIGFGFDSAGQVVPYFRHTYSPEETEKILDVVNSQLIPDFYEHIPLDYKVKLRLSQKASKSRKEVAGRIQRALEVKGLEWKVVLQTARHINILKFDKAMAARYFMERTGLREEEVLIVGDRARSFGADRSLLTAFPKAISINVGSTSPTIRNENPNIIQTEPKNVSATEAILDAVCKKQLMRLLSDIGLHPNAAKI
ncbi:HEAT repeat domain-containing protein [Candidatus Poribacteria bacterium]|nr:HEAT repeat domain-containing protein [Candidatus Poribacteria bacterium]